MTYFFHLLIREREKEEERETPVCCYTHLCTHWLPLACGGTHNLGVKGDALTNGGTRPGLYASYLNAHASLHKLNFIGDQRALMRK